MNIWEYREKLQFLARIMSAPQQEIGRAPAGARSEFSPEISLSLKNPKYSFLVRFISHNNFFNTHFSKKQLQPES
jgi:hypothetical protein